MKVTNIDTTLEFMSDGDQVDVFVYAGGNLIAHCDLPPATVARLAGWLEAVTEQP